MHYVWESSGQVLVGGRPLSTIDKGWVRERAEVAIGSVEWLFRNDGGWGRSNLVAERGGSEVMRATRTGFWTHTWTIESSHAPLEIRPSGFLSWGLELTRDGSPVGTFRRHGVLQNRTDLTTSEDLAPELATFVLWVASVEHDRRHRRSAAASS